MLKEMGYQEKFGLLQTWLIEIIEAVKKDLKSEHLKIDREFCKRYFLGKNPNHIQVEEMVDAYRQDIAEGNIGLGEFIATRWLLKNTDIYGYFEENLKEITPDFDQLDQLDQELSSSLMEGSVKQYGATKTYLFVIFNSVLFPGGLIEQLRGMAEQETSKSKMLTETKQRSESLEVLQKRHTREMAAMKDRYEKKLSGMQKKYLADTATLKKQITQLQMKVDG